jgi:ATP-binding cassette subfamily F protein 2
MPSYKKGKKKPKNQGGGAKAKQIKPEADDAGAESIESLVRGGGDDQHNKISDISCTGQCAMSEGAKDIKFISFSMQYLGEVLIEDTTLELNYGNRYGLIGRNGSGKTTFLRALATREIALPSHIDCFFLDHEAPISDLTALEMVIKGAKDEVARLEGLEEQILTTSGPDDPILIEIGDRLDELDPDSFEKRAGELLFGLGFKDEFLLKKTKDMSGGWRMRVSLAQALFIRPTLLLLDEPTNHLDLETCIWLERYLATYDKILVVVSHSQDFMNEVCTNMMQLTAKKKLAVYGGNYATYVKTKTENEIQQMKQYEKQQKEIKHIKDFIASCGVYANMVKQAASRQKMLDKMEAAGLIECVDKESVLNLSFPACEKLAPPPFWRWTIWGSATTAT